MFVLSHVFPIPCLTYPMSVLSPVCPIPCLSYPMFVQSHICPIPGLFYLRYVPSHVCPIPCMSFTNFVLSHVCPIALLSSTTLYLLYCPYPLSPRTIRRILLADLYSPHILNTSLLQIFQSLVFPTFYLQKRNCYLRASRNNTIYPVIK